MTYRKSFQPPLGFLQLVGCLGALRLSERLLNAYWLLLLTLLLGDAVIGVFWFFKFERILGELTPTLKHRLSTEYGVLSEFTELWDRLQSETRCCGLMGQVITRKLLTPSNCLALNHYDNTFKLSGVFNWPRQDFHLTTNRTIPASCCPADLTEQISISRRPLASAVVFRSDGMASLSGSVAAHHPKSNFSDIADMAWGHAVTESRGAGDEVAKTLCKVVFPTVSLQFYYSFRSYTLSISV